MGDGGFVRLILASLAATAVLAFAFGGATALWLVSPYLHAATPTVAETATPSAAGDRLGSLPSTGALVPAAAASPVETPAAAPSPATGSTASTDDVHGAAAGPAAPAEAAASAPAGAPPMAQPRAPAGAPPAAVSGASAGASPAAAAMRSPTPSPTPPRALSDRRDQTYQVQLGTFRDAATAERLKTILEERGFAIGIVESRLDDGGPWHLARSADFDLRADALRLAARLHRELGIDPLVVRSPPARAPSTGAVPAGDAG